MNPTPIPQILDMPDGATVYLVHGRIKTVQKRHTGTVSKGPRTGEPWAIQNLTIEYNGATIDVMVNDREDEIPKSWQGRMVRLEAYHGEKGWSGLYAFDDTYKNKTTRKLKVTGTGEVALLDGEPAVEGSAPSEQHYQQQPQRQAPQQQSPQQPPAQRQAHPQQRQQPPADDAAAAAANEKLRLREAKAKATQIANLQLLCLNRVADYVAPRFKERSGRELSMQEIHALGMNMTIEMMRAGEHWKMPPHEVEAPKPRQAPKQWPKQGEPGWPEGAVPHPETGQPMDPETGNFIF